MAAVRRTHDRSGAGDRLHRPARGRALDADHVHRHELRQRAAGGSIKEFTVYGDASLARPAPPGELGNGQLRISDTYSAAKAVDFNSALAGPAAGTGDPSWLVVDLGTSRTVTRMKTVAYLHHSDPVKYKIEYAVTANAWLTYVEHTRQVVPGFDSLPAPVVARWVRITFTDTDFDAAGSRAGASGSSRSSAGKAARRRRMPRPPHMRWPGHLPHALLPRHLPGWPGIHRMGDAYPDERRRRARSATRNRESHAENAVQVRNLRKSYCGRAVVDDVSFDITHGETFALLGPERRGQVHHGRDPRGVPAPHERRGRACSEPTRRGRARLEGPHRDRAAGDRRAGRVTVREQLRQFAGFYPDPRDVDEVHRGRRPGGAGRGPASRKLSGGQQRRVDVALGIIGDPELLFLDEPTTGFDPQARREFWDLIRCSSAKDDDPAHHPLPRRGRAARRPGRRHRRRTAAGDRPGRRSAARSARPVVRWTRASAVRARSAPRSGRSSPASSPAPGRSRRPADRAADLEDIYLGLVAEHTGAAASADAPSRRRNR